MTIPEARTFIIAEAARSRQPTPYLMRVALGSRADLGNDIAHAAGALVAARNGALADWPDTDVALAALTLMEVRPE